LHHQLLNYFKNLQYSDLDNFDKAKELEEKALNLNIKLNGELNIYTLNSMKNLYWTVKIKILI
jgi:hypothetical protein